MTQIENTSLNLSVVTDILNGNVVPWIKSHADIDWLNTNRIKGRKKLMTMQFHYICDNCHQECHKQLLRIKEFPILCQTCYISLHKAEIQAKREQTCLQKYGATSALGVDEFREKGYETNLAKYGDRHPQSTQVFKDKVKNTCISRYGVCAPSQSPEIYAKQVELMRQRYGVDNVNKLETCKQKIKQTKKLRYGDENYCNAEKVKATKLAKYGDASYNNIEKMKATQIAKYGGIGFASTELAQKVRDKIYELYGVDHPMHSHDLFCKTKFKYEYNGILFDSKPEIALYKSLTESHTEFTYQPDISFPYVYDGKTHYYHPDFLIGDEIIELKGSHFFDDDGRMINPYDRSLDGLAEAKHQCMITNGVKIIIV